MSMLMKQYANELYKSLKKLDSYKDESPTNESIDINSNYYKGVTLHA